MLDKSWSVGVKITTNKDPTVRSGDCHPWNTSGASWKNRNGPPECDFLYSRVSSKWEQVSRSTNDRTLLMNCPAFGVRSELGLYSVILAARLGVFLPRLR